VKNAASIGQVCELVTDGTHYTPKPVPSGVPFLTVKDMTANGLDFINCAKISASDFADAARANCAPKRGDVLFSKDGTVGKVHVVNESREFSVLSSIAILRPKRERILSGYLTHVLKSPRVIFQAQQRKTGSAIRRIILKDLQDVRIPLPPLSEQRRIAAILDQADALRTKRREALAKLDEMAQAIFVEMFGDVLLNLKRFTVVRMSNLLDCSPNFGSMIPPREDRLEWLSLRVANIQDWKLSLESKKYIDLMDKDVVRHTVKDGDIILARAIASQEHLGKCVVVFPGEEKWAFDSHIMRVRVNRKVVSPIFLRDFFQSSGGREIFLKSTRKTTVQYNINTKEFSSMEIPLPPLKKQREYENAISGISTRKSEAEVHSRLLNDLFFSLQHRAFSGDL
jgi:type I restriction enzyme, S subunit